jgi:hypothetical protein
MFRHKIVVKMLLINMKRKYYIEINSYASQSYIKMLHLLII